MPELPEVEIIKRGLEQKIIGRTIASVDVRESKIFQGRKEDVVDSKIINIKRRAKMIVIELSNQKSLLIHLKMTGQLIFDRKPNDKTTRTAGGHPSKDWVADLPSQFTRVIFVFTDGSVLYFNDLRKFGYIKVYKSSEIDDLKVLRELGPEPFDKEFTAEYLLRCCDKKPRTKIKQLLIDQTIISGVGNIYADESLFCAHISPLRLGRDIKLSELRKIAECVKEVLTKALKMGGSSENTFVDVEGKRGQMQNHFLVYRQTGRNCPNGCGKIMRTTVGGRGTHYCPICQV